MPKFLLKIARRHMAADFEFEVAIEESRIRAAESILAEAHALVARLEDSLSEFRVDSPVARFNAAPVGEWIPFDESSEEVFRLARMYAELSGGYFDPFAKTAFIVAESGPAWESSAGRIRKLVPDVRLSFGAIGKGYALDRVAAILEREGLHDFRINCGGSSWVIRGGNADGTPWDIAWAWDRDADGDYRGQPLEFKRDESLAIGISGVLEQGNHFRFRGVAAPDRMLSAFYAGRSAAESDALSTALFVGASFEGAEILTRLASAVRNPSLAYVDKAGQIVYNRGFEKRFSRS